MTRRLLIKAHLIVASFFAPALVIIAISGGLYLVNIKGTVEETAIQVPADVRLDLTSETIETDVRALFNKLNIDHEFEYLRAGDAMLTTRPTSQTYYVLQVSAEHVTISRNVPSLQKRLIELHKGHGPLLFKDFQKVMAVALLFVLLSGAWLGLSSVGLRNTTMVTIGGGLVLFLWLAFLS